MEAVFFRLRIGQRLRRLARLIVLLLLTGMPTISGYGQGTLPPGQWRVTFDGNPPMSPGNVFGVTNYFEAGMWFKATRYPY